MSSVICFIDFAIDSGNDRREFFSAVFEVFVCWVTVILGDLSAVKQCAVCGCHCVVCGVRSKVSCQRVDDFVAFDRRFCVDVLMLFSVC